MSRAVRQFHRETKLDMFLTRREWHWNGEAFVTVCDGVGFILYKVQLTMMLAGVAPDELARLVSPEAMQVWWKFEEPGPLGILTQPEGLQLVAHMFEIPADPHVVSAAVNSAFDLRL